MTPSFPLSATQTAEDTPQDGYKHSQPAEAANHFGIPLEINLTDWPAEKFSCSNFK